MLYINDVARLIHRGADLWKVDIKSILRPVTAAPETKTIYEMLDLFRRNNSRSALIFNEWGSVDGLVTLRQVMRFIVNAPPKAIEIEKSYEKADNGGYVVSGQMNIERVNDIMKVNLKSPRMTTIGGLIFQKLDRLPAVGDVVELQGIIARVTQMKRHRILKVDIISKSSLIHDTNVSCNSQSDITPIIIYPIVFISKVLWPVKIFFSRIASWAARLVGGRPDHGLFVSRKQLSAVLQVAEQNGALGKLNEGQLRCVLDFSDTTVSKVMLPMDKMIVFDKATPTKVIINQAIRSGHRRFPIYDKHKQNVTGIAMISNWALLDMDFADYPLEKLTSPALYTGTDESLDDILPLILNREDRMAIVIDDNKNAIGMVTFEDLISSAIGDINITK